MFMLFLGMSCNRQGWHSCLRCKLCFCDDHVRRKGVKYERNQAIPCPKCGYPTAQTKDLSMSGNEWNVASDFVKYFENFSYSFSS